jgi:TldD protein
MTYPPSRRDFLATTSMALMSPLLVERPHPRRIVLPADAGRSRLPANAWLPDATAEDTLRALATTAMEAAKGAGAAYADIRVAERHFLLVSVNPAQMRWISPDLKVMLAYGVRVIVDGVTAFIYGSTLTPDGVAAAARSAVQTARGFAQKTTTRAELAPTPVVAGTWTTPHEIDPFTVSLEDHAAALGAYRAAMGRVLHGRDLADYSSILRWTRERRVFASTAGSLMTQTLFHSAPSMVAAGDLGRGGPALEVTSLNVPGLSPMSGGFETVTSPAHQDTIKRVTEEAVQLAALPRGMVDVGRYPVVFDGEAYAAILGQTLGPALEGDRIFGFERDASGDSFVKPEALGTPIASPVLTVTANRAVPSVTAVQWDDEGVAPDEYTCIRDGKLVDLHTSRATAPLLADWYQSQGMPMRSHGCAVAARADYPVMVRAPHMTVTPATKPASLNELCRTMGRGLLIRGLPSVSTDSQFSSASITMGGNNFGVCEMFEVVGGVPARSIHGSAIEFATSKFLQALMAVGDATTLRNTGAFELFKGNPWTNSLHSVAAPAAVVKDVNVIATDIQL